MYQAFDFLEPDYNYLDNHAKLLKNNTPIESMNIEQLSNMFTFIQRGERFFTGHMSFFIEGGTILQLLLQLKKLTKNK